MGFQSIPKVEKYAFYLDLAFRKARIKASEKRSTLKIEFIKKLHVIEIEKINVISGTLKRRLSDITSSFPDFDNLTEFYQELVKAFIDFKTLKKSLGAMNWARKKVEEFANLYRPKIRRARDKEAVNKISKEYYGRISSFLKQVSKEMAFLEEVRVILKGFPSIKDGLFTVAITGFPNVGKTTLLSKITGSKPDIQPYAFTTKNLNTGYIEHNHKKIQFIDTPGSLNRLNKMNNIEKTAYLSIKYCSHIMIFVFDITEPYPLSEQEELFEKLKDFDKDTFVYLSKTDFLDKKQVTAFKKKHKNIITDVDELKEAIIKESTNF